MHGLKKAKTAPAQPHEFNAEVEINRPPSKVYPLLDLAIPAKPSGSLVKKWRL